MAELYTDQISSSVSGVSTQGGHVVEQSKLKIAVLDNGKIPYDEAIKNVDRNLQNIIVETNSHIGLKQIPFGVFKSPKKTMNFFLGFLS